MDVKDKALQNDIYYTDHYRLVLKFNKDKI